MDAKKRGRLIMGIVGFTIFLFTFISFLGNGAMSAEPSKYQASQNYAVAMESADPDAIDANIANWNTFIKLARNNPKAKDQVAEAEQHIKDLQARKEALKSQ